MNTSLLRRTTGVALTGLLLATGGAAAYADEIANKLDTSIDSTVEVMALNVGTSGTTTLYLAPTNGDGKEGCNLTGSKTLVASVSSDSAAVATVSPSSVTFTSCGDTKTLTVHPVATGSATITLTQTSNDSGGTFDLTTATFTVSVTAPAPANTAPEVAVTGVAAGGSYQVGTVPAAVCSVTDKEDGPSTFAATLGAITGPLASYELGTREASCTYTDKGGLKATASVTYSIVDTTKPAITYVSRTAANGNGWNNGDVTVKWSCTDNVGVAASTVTESLSTEGANKSATGTCTDIAGNTASDTQSGINIDKTAPTISAAVSPNRPSSGWWNLSTGAPTVSYACDDALSGVDSCSSPSTFGEGPDQTDTGTATDKAGNTAQAPVINIDVDLTKPTISGATSPDRPATGWWNSASGAPKVTYSCADTLSGIETCTQPHTFGAGEDQTHTGTATDQAGNANTAGVSNIDVDLTAPAITATVTPEAASTGWWNLSTGAPKVTYECSDGLSGLADTCPEVYTFGEGTAMSHSETIYDKAGNPGKATLSGVDVDLKVPGIAYDSRTPANAWGWNKGDVTVNWSCSDVNGVSAATVSATVTTEGLDQSALGICSDVAGNTASDSEDDINIDKTAPGVVWNGGPAADGTSSYFFGSVPSATCTATDGLSGAQSCEVSAGAGTVTEPGKVHTISATAKDKADNATTEARSYTVKAWTLGGFYQPVDMGGIVNTVKNGSTVPLKFEVFAGTTELTDIAVVNKFSVTKMACATGVLTDDIELVTTGSTSLRYDTTGGQFVQNWKTPSIPGACYQVTMETDDGSSISANFKLK